MSRAVREAERKAITGLSNMQARREEEKGTYPRRFTTGLSCNRWSIDPPRLVEGDYPTATNQPHEARPPLHPLDSQTP